MRGNVIGVVRPSSSGKSSLANTLAARIGAKVFCLDDYWVKGVHRPQVNGAPSYERPEQYNGEAMADAIRESLAAVPERPIIAEGFLAYCYDGILAITTQKLFVDVAEYILVARRISRGRRSGRSGRDPWLSNGNEEWSRFGAFQKDIPGVNVLDGTLPVEQLVEMVISDLHFEIDCLGLPPKTSQTPSLS